MNLFIQIQCKIKMKNFFISQKLFSFSSQVPFWQGFTDEVESFKEQTKSLSHEELITLTEDVQSRKISL